MANFPDTGVDPLAPTIFHEPWWLDIATGGRYAVAEVVEHGKVVGRMPYYFIKKILGLSVVDLPPLTHFLGPAIVDCEGKPNTIFANRFSITQDLIHKLPETSSFLVKCHRDVTDVIAFQMAGFRAGVQFTQEIFPQPLDDIWTNLRLKARNHIRSARKGHHVTAGNDPDLFMHFYADCIKQNKGVANYLDTSLHSKLIRACLERDRGKIYEAREHDGTLVAAIFCAWDKVSAYYLMTCRNSTAHRGSTNLLLWEAISDALSRKLIFDFDGFVNEGTLQTANNFASVLAPRYIAVRESRVMRIYRSVKSVIKPQPSELYALGLAI